MGSRSWLLAALTTAGGCVTGGGGAGTGVGALGTVLVLSQITQEAKEGAPSAQKLWCGTLRRVHGQLVLWQGKDHSEDDLVEELTQPTYELARSNGYDLHRTQIRMLVVDARNVASDSPLYAREEKTCP